MNSLAAFILILLGMPIKNILHLEGTGAKTGGGGLIQIFSAACAALCNGQSLGAVSASSGKVCVLFKRHCAILHCVEKQLQREKWRVEVGRADVCGGNETN